jgi:hypothetical protein
VARDERKILAQGLQELTLHQKRRLTRIVCRYPVTCHWEQHAVNASVVDMGLGGLRLSLSEPPPAGASMLVQLDPPLVGAFPVRGRVQWSEGQEAGMAYLDQPGNLERSWVQRVLKLIGFDEQAIFERRLHVRVASSLPARLDTAEARLLNLGVRGALVQSAQAREVGQGLEATIGPLGPLPPLTLSAEVVRCRPTEDGRFNLGLVFLEPVGEPARQLESYVLALIKS